MVILGWGEREWNGGETILDIGCCQSPSVYFIFKNNQITIID